MRHRTLLLALALGALVGVGSLSAQPTPAPPEPNRTPADVTAPGETKANLSPREMVDQAKKRISEMEGFHVRVLQLQAAARKSKDVIKLNCVNEKLLAVKQLLNIAEVAENDLTEALASGDRDAQVHQYSQVMLAHERATGERDEAEGCIGEEIVFVGPTQVDVDGPTMPDDPTDDPEDPFSGTVVDFEPVVYATPYR
ncbi:MAG: hypothetical protein K8M05_10750 [Deltaproteobacteria bacterium]|nr:hypothetical protein [Kofleriaceae bacterium]